MNGYDARWMEFGRDGRLTPKSKSFATAQAREKFFERLDKAGKHVQNVSFADPDVVESALDEEERLARKHAGKDPYDRGFVAPRKKYPRLTPEDEKLFFKQLYGIYSDIAFDLFEHDYKKSMSRSRLIEILLDQFHCRKGELPAETFKRLAEWSINTPNRIIVEIAKKNGFECQRYGI